MKAIPTKILLGGAFLLLVVVAVVMFSNQNPQQVSPEKTGISSESGMQAQFAKLTVHEPLTDVPTPEETVIIDNPSQATVLTLMSGSKIKVPANAFVNEKGEIITSPVTIHFKEYHDAAEIIASGIPMRVRKANGEDDWMQTAGMFEIRGSTNHHSVNIADGKSLNVSLVSKVDGAYDFWYFNEAQGNWDNLMPGVTPDDAMTTTAASPEALEEEIRQLRQATATPPKAPEYDTKNNLAFSDLDIKLCPELKGKTPLILNYAGNDDKAAPKNNKWITRPDIWTKKSLKPTNEPGIYKLTLLGDTIYSIPVKLALEPVDIERAKARYEEQLATFEANKALIREKESILKQQANFRRSMQVANFGIHNYDILINFEDAVPLLADFDFGNYPEDIKELVTVYLITGEGRTVVGLPKSDWHKFRFSPSSDNKLVAVLPGNKIALFTQSDFKAEMNQLKQSAKKTYVFKMRVEDQAVNSVADLNKKVNKASS